MVIGSLIKACLTLMVYRGTTDGIEIPPRTLYIVLTLALISGTVVRVQSGQFTNSEALSFAIAEYGFVLLSTWTLVFIFSKHENFTTISALFLCIGILGDAGFIGARTILSPDHLPGLVTLTLIGLQLLGMARAVNQFFNLHHGFAASFAAVYFIGLVGFMSFATEISKKLTKSDGYVWMFQSTLIGGA